MSIPGTKGSAKLSIFGFSTKDYQALIFEVPEWFTAGPER
jgi:hypothetical protein